MKVALDKGGATPVTLTAALELTSANAEAAPIVDLLKKAGAQPSLQVDAAVLQTYAGKYKGDPGPEISVTVKDGKLFATLGRDAYPLMAIDKTTFRPIAFSGVTISFNIEADKVTSATLKQGPYPATPLKKVE